MQSFMNSKKVDILNFLNNKLAVFLISILVYLVVSCTSRKKCLEPNLEIAKKCFEKDKKRLGGGWELLTDVESSFEKGFVVYFVDFNKDKKKDIIINYLFTPSPEFGNAILGENGIIIYENRCDSFKSVFDTSLNVFSELKAVKGNIFEIEEYEFKDSDSRYFPSIQYLSYYSLTDNKLKFLKKNKLSDNYFPPQSPH